MSDRTTKTTYSDRYFRTDHLLNSIGARTARGGVVTIFSHGCKFAVAILATAVLARLLTPDDYGLIAMVAVVTNFVSMFKDLGLALATVQKPEISLVEVSTLFWVNISLSIGLCLILVSLSPVVAWFYGEPRVTKITAVTALGLVLGGLSLQHEALLKRQMRFFVLSIIAFISMTVGYVVGIVMATRGFGYWSLVFNQMALLGANTAGVWLACRWVPTRPTRYSDVKSMLAFGGNVTGYAAVNYFARNADHLFIGRVAGPQQLGFYAKATQILGLPTDQLSEPINSVAIPALSRLAQDPDRYREAYRRIVEKVLMFTMPAIALMMSTSDWLVQIMLGPQWGGASRILVLLGLAFLFQPLVNTGGWVLLTQGRTREMFHWSLVSAPFSILSIVIGLPWGAVGVAASYSLARLLVINPLMFWFIGRAGPVRTSDFYRLMAPYTAASLVVALSCVMFRLLLQIENPLIGLVICSIVGGVAALVTLLLIPAGRSAIMDVKHSLKFLKPNRRSTKLEHA
jgi:PST family polysaccharide transporter